MKKVLFYFGHPAQYLFLRATIRNLMQNNIKVVILIKTKDVLEDLITADGVPYKNILPKRRGDTKLAIVLSLIKRLVIILPYLLREKPKLLVGEDATMAILGRILRISRITITEDDYDIIKDLAKISYPNTETILTPKVCEVGKFERKKVGYSGYMKLGYLHPNVFNSNFSALSKYNLPDHLVLVRLARLTAFHDQSVKGISMKLLDDILNIAKENNCSVRIISEYKLKEELSPYLLNINPSDLHHVLAYASLLISDSQSMSVEAAMLGTPSLRFSSFAGKISVLEELEHKYKLTYGIDPSSPDQLLQKFKELISQKNLKGVFSLRREKMLKDKIDVTAFLTWFISNYPESISIMKENPDFQHNFK